MSGDHINDDWWPNWEEQESATNVRELLEPGTYSAKIIKAEATYRDRVPEKWSETNPEGRQLTVKLAIKHAGREHHVYVDIPAHWRSSVERVCDAAGIARPAKGTTWSTKLLVGKAVRVETSLYEGRRVNVDRWHPDDIVDSGRQPEAVPPHAAPAPAARKPAARTPAQRIARDAGEEPGGSDDIPF